MIRAHAGAFRAALITVLNTHSIEQDSDTADAILADYLIACLDAWQVATIRRERGEVPPPQTEAT